VRGGGGMWFDAETELAGAAGRVQAGGPAPGARTVAAWDDGRPAATAKRLGDGCVVFVGTELEGGELPFQAAYPAALARLARGCDATAGTADPRPLDPGAIAVLRGRGPAAVAASAVGAAEAGVALGRWAPWRLVPMVVVGALVPVISMLGNLGEPHWSNLRQLSPWPRYPDHDLLFTDPPVWWHLLWLASLGALMAFVAFDQPA